MKGHARGARLRHPHQRRAQLILVALACVIVVLSAWLIVVLTLYSALGDAAFRRHPALLPAHPFASYFATTASLAVARAKAIAANPKDSHALDVASVPHDVGGRTAVVVDGAIPESERKRIADTYIKLTGRAATDGWHREKASDASLEHNAMAKNMPFDECDGAPLDAIRALLPHFYDQCSPARPSWVTRCTIYAQSFADVDEAHEDRSHDGDAFSVTAIWYPHERWHPHWGGETVFLSSSAGGADAELVLPVLPKPGRLLLFDSEISHMAQPPTVIAEPFAPPMTSKLQLASTRTTGNRFSFVFRTLCGRRSSRQLVADHDRDDDGKLSRGEAVKLFSSLDMGAPEMAYRKLAAAARRRQGAAAAAAVLAEPADLDVFFGVADEPKLRASLRGAGT